MFGRWESCKRGGGLATSEETGWGDGGEYSCGCGGGDAAVYVGVCGADNVGADNGGADDDGNDDGNDDGGGGDDAAIPLGGTLAGGGICKGGEVVCTRSDAAVAWANNSSTKSFNALPPWWALSCLNALMLR